MRSVSSTPRYTRPRPGLHGSSDFVHSLRRVLTESTQRDRGYASILGGDREPGPVELGVHESAAGEGYVNVRLDSTGQVVRARFSGFVPGYELEVGDELGVEFVDDGWRTIPEVRHTIKHRDRIEFWGTNRVTGEVRLLAQNHYE